MSEFSVSIVIPIWGPPALTDACIHALNWTCDDAMVVLVDNTGHYDVPECRNLHAVFRNPENVGFAKACNQGAQASSSDIICFLNCDAEPQLDWLLELMKAFDDPDVAMAGPRIHHPDGGLQTAGIRTWHGGGAAGGEEIKQDLPTRDVDGVTGACLAIRRSVFEALGGLDESFKNGYEDVDLCLAVREAGHRVRYVAESAMMHHESATGPERWAHAGENVEYMNRKWGSR